MKNANREFQQSIAWLQETIYCWQLRIRTSNRPVSIICNNCFGGSIYQNLARQYTSPFVGLFLYPECFIRLTHKFEKVIFSNLKFIESSKYQIANWQRETYGKYPLATLDDEIEIHFVHYKNTGHANFTWEKRRERLVMSNLRFILVQRELCTPVLVENFFKDNRRISVCFVSFTSPSFNKAVPLRECAGKSYVTDLIKYPQVYRKQFDMAAWLNLGILKPSVLYRTLLPLVNSKRYDYSLSREYFIDHLIN